MMLDTKCTVCHWETHGWTSSAVRVASCTCPVSCAQRSPTHPDVTSAEWRCVHDADISVIPTELMAPPHVCSFLVSSSVCVRIVVVCRGKGGGAGGRWEQQPGLWPLLATWLLTPSERAQPQAEITSWARPVMASALFFKYAVNKRWWITHTINTPPVLQK